MGFREIVFVRVGSELRGAPEAPGPVLCTALLQPAGVGSQAELIAFDISSQQVDVKPPPPALGWLSLSRVHPRSHGEPLGWGLAWLGGSMRPWGSGVGPQQMSGLGGQGLQPDAEEACDSLPTRRPENICATSKAAPSLIAVILA